MKEMMNKWREQVTQFWQKRSKGQKGMIFAGIGVIALLVILLAVLSRPASNNFVPLYNDLSVQEVSQVKTELDARAIPYEVAPGGASILVPQEQADTLLVDFAGMGIPDSGSIDYSFFSENTSWGITDNEFDVMKLDAMQTELATLISNIDGIQAAEVMINMPEEPVFASESTGEASASIVINTEAGYQFEGNQIDSLYHLVSKAVPNLPEDNIVIMNQYFEYYDKNSQTASDSGGTYSNQQGIKDQVERDIQRRLQQMLGAMVGAENVIVSVTSDIDFTQENRTEELVEPVDVENMEGLPVSIEDIQESYTGEGAPEGVVGTGEEDIANYPAADGGAGDYELDQETINYEFNRIRREISESPYKVRDLGIQVAINSETNAAAGEETETLSQQEQATVEEGVQSILDSIIATSIDAEFAGEAGQENASIVFQPFSGGNQQAPESPSVIPVWMYIVGGVLLVIIIALVVLLMRGRGETFEEEMVFAEEGYEDTIMDETEKEVPDMPAEESEGTVRRKQLEKMAQDKPEEFAKLLRSWIAED